VPQLTIEVPPSNDQLVVNYNYDQSVTVVFFFLIRKKMFNSRFLLA
jgi:hypothetical protein